MKKEKFISHPYVGGGNKAIEKTVSENLTYPMDALSNHKEGTVSLKYDIDQKGQVIATRVISSVGYGCDEEAIRLVKLLRFIVPKQPKGLKVVFHKEIHIHFRLPKEAPKVIEPPIIPPPQYSYSYKLLTTPKVQKPFEKSGKSFQIVVKY